jgi:predicted acylesterase/phospholipase RssA
VKRAAVVLSGGGAKTAAQIGALRALSERDVEIVHYVGTSMGAVVASAFASGVEYSKLVQKVSSLSRSDVASPSVRALLGPFTDSLLSDQPLRETISDLVEIDSFDQMETPLTVTATDAASGELALFGAGGMDGGSLIDVLYSSCALPVFYPPGEISGRHYYDGGLRSVLPVEQAVLLQPDLIFAVMVGPITFDQDYNAADNRSLIDAHRISTRIMMGAQTERKLSDWTSPDGTKSVLVRPRVDGDATFSVDRVVNFVEEGYRAAVRKLNRAGID